MKKVSFTLLSLCMLGALAGGFAACQKDTPDTEISSAPAAPTIENSHRLSQNDYGEVICDHCGATLYEGTIFYEHSKNEKYYIASGGSDIGEELILPAYYKARGDVEYLPVLEANCFSSPYLKKAELSPVVESVKFPQNNPIEELVVPENSLHFSIKDNVLFDKSGEKLTYYLPSKTNATYAVPLGVKEIRKAAFASCTNIKSVYLPQSVERIQDSAFKYCTNLASVTFSEGVKKIQANAFSHCINLASVILPDSIELIGDSAFKYCTNLTSVILPKNLKTLNNEVFSECGLLEISLPSEITTLGNYCFSYCDALTEVKIPEDAQLQHIGDHAFEHCVSLSSFTLPDRVTELLYGTFYYCTSLETVNISAKAQLQKIAGACFANCTALTAFKIPQSVVEIEDRAFQNCTGVKSIVIPRSVQIMGYETFSGWTQGQTIYVYFKENESPERWAYYWAPRNSSYGPIVVYEYTGT